MLSLLAMCGPQSSRGDNAQLLHARRLRTADTVFDTVGIELRCLVMALWGVLDWGCGGYWTGGVGRRKGRTEGDASVLQSFVIYQSLRVLC